MSVSPFHCNSTPIRSDLIEAVLTTAHYAESEKERHHEIEWFLLTSIGQGLDTPKVLIGDYPMNNRN
jgi:hypothetical protein